MLKIFSIIALLIPNTIKIIVYNIKYKVLFKKEICHWITQMNAKNILDHCTANAFANTIKNIVNSIKYIGTIFASSSAGA